MSVQVVQYIDLRHTIDVNPPSYHYIPYKGKSVGELSAGEEEHPSRQESRQSSKDTKKKSETLKPSKTPSKSPNRILKEKSGKGSKEFADASIQDEGGDVAKAFVEKANEASRQATRQSRNLEPVIEGDGSEFPNAFDLDDEEAWASVSPQQLPGRFLQYRQLGRAKIKELEDQLQVTLTKTHRKVNSLKSQFSEHKSKWEAERKVLIEQVEQAQKLQTDAEKEADAAMTQLEEFINEQEKLEDEEEQKRQEIIKTMSRPGTVKQTTPLPADQKQDIKPDEQADRLQSENSEQELKNLMQQTDDAKAQKNARHTGAISAPPAVEPGDSQAKKLSQIEREPVMGNTEEEVRQSSAKSRASLRNQFKSRLDETRQAVEDRRTKSPVIAVPTQKSVDDELIMEDDDDDLPIPDDMKEEAFLREDTLDAGTSPPPTKQEASRKISMASRKSTNLVDHPVVQEFLRAYTGIHNFKEAMSRVLVDKDQMSASQILSDIDVIPFKKDDKVVPQVSNMTENIYFVLNEVSQVINSVLQNDRGPVVSSLMMGMSRDATQRTIMREKSGATADVHPETRGSQRTVSTKTGSVSTDAAQYQELQTQYEKLQNQMSEESKKYEEQQRHNVVVMMEMQDTINQLQRELSALGKQTRRPLSESVSTAGAQNNDSAIMFTRLDSERNAKIMKKAVNEKKLDPNRYKEAVVQMDEYVNLPAQRLAHLVRKYVHHCRMKEIEENVQKSQSLNQNVFELFDKMEALQNQRAKRWADRMDEMGVERYRLASMLMETLDSIEQESGLFLIKPMYSYRGREPKEPTYSGKITRPFRPHRNLSPLRDNSSAHAPAPTPASNVRTRNQARKEDMYQGQPTGQIQYESKGPLEGDTTGLMGSSVGYMAGQPRTTWSMADSQIGMNNPMFGNVNTPRILELDINRMMIGQNTISAQIGSPGLSNDRLVNAANNNLRAYMTVNRPGPNSAGRSDRPHSGSRQSPRPASSPTNHSASTAKRVRLSDVEIPTVMTSSQPLPPIGMSQDKPKSGSTKGSRSPPRIPVGNELPESPPGSSLRHSPPGMEDTEVTSPVK